MISEAFGPKDDFDYFANLLNEQRKARLTAHIGPQTQASIMALNRTTTPRQVGGTHYAKMAIDPFTYAQANNLDSLQFSVVKYVSRFRDKGGIEDLNKAIDCLQRLIKHEMAKK